MPDSEPGTTAEGETLSPSHEPPWLFHYTDQDGYNAIRSQPTWTFKAAEPPGDHPSGAYFTPLGPDTTNLARRLRIPNEKLTYVFVITDDPELKPLRGGRGAFIRYSSEDYIVEKDRQVFHGSRDDAAESLR